MRDVYKRQIERSGAIGDEGGAGNGNILTSPRKGEDGGRSPLGGGQYPHCIASFTNSSSASAKSVSAASP